MNVFQFFINYFLVSGLFRREQQRSFYKPAARLPVLLHMSWFNIVNIFCCRC